MSILKRLQEYRKPKRKQPEQEEQDTEDEKDLAQIEEETRQRIKTFLYEDRLVEEILPAFMALNESEHAETFYELIEAKETELNNVLDNPESFEQDSDPDNVEDLPEQEEETDETDYVCQILEQKYGE